MRASQSTVLRLPYNLLILGLKSRFPLQDLDQLRRLMEPIIMQLERATAGASLAGRDVASLALLVRRTKEYLSMLSAL